MICKFRDYHSVQACGYCFWTQSVGNNIFNYGLAVFAQALKIKGLHSVVC